LRVMSKTFYIILLALGGFTAVAASEFRTPECAAYTITLALSISVLTERRV